MLLRRLRFLVTATANPRCRLAPRMPSQRCVHTILQPSKISFTGIPKRLDRKPLMLPITSPHHHRRQCSVTGSPTRTANDIQSP
jgi:hypothetical protein